MLQKILQSINLSAKEASLYLAALRTGPAPISIIAKRASVSRSTGYNVLQRLYKKGLVRKVDKANLQYFSAITPAEIIEVLDRKRETIGQKMEMFKTYLPQFDALISPTLVMPKVTFYEGVSGIKQIYQDILKTGQKETFAALSLDNMVPELKDWVRKIFTNKKIKKKISSKVIVSSETAGKYRKLDKKHLRESLVVPFKKYPFEVEIDVYDQNKTAFISFDESELLGVIIESPKIANTLKSLFTLIWEKKNINERTRNGGTYNI